MVVSSSTSPEKIYGFTQKLKYFEPFVSFSSSFRKIVSIFIRARITKNKMLDFAHPHTHEKSRRVDLPRLENPNNNERTTLPTIQYLVRVVPYGPMQRSLHGDLPYIRIFPRALRRSYHTYLLFTSIQNTPTPHTFSTDLTKKVFVQQGMVPGKHTSIIIWKSCFERTQGEQKAK